MPANPSTYRYFISYAGPSGFGWADISFPRPIRTGRDVIEVTERLQRDRGLSSVSVISFQRFEQ